MKVRRWEVEKYLNLEFGMGNAEVKNEGRGKMDEG